MHELNIQLKPSKQFIALILLTMSGSLAIICYLPFSIWLKLILAFFSLSYGAYILWNHGLLRHSQSIIQIMLDKKDWYISNHSDVFKAQIAGDSTLSSWLCVLRFSLPQKRFKRSVVIFNDALEADHYRRLLVALRNA